MSGCGVPLEGVGVKRCSGRAGSAGGLSRRCGYSRPSCWSWALLVEREAGAERKRREGRVGEGCAPPIRTRLQSASGALGQIPTPPYGRWVWGDLSCRLLCRARCVSVETVVFLGLPYASHACMYFCIHSVSVERSLWAKLSVRCRDTVKNKTDKIPTSWSLYSSWGAS